MASDKGMEKRKREKEPKRGNEMDEIFRIREKLKKALKPDRYEHSLSVSFTSVCLAMRYGYDLRKAELAGMLHDCAKEFGKEELLKLCRKDGISLSDDILKAPQVIHSIYGASYAKKAYGVSDEEVLSAIYYHTLGRPNMRPLEAVVFVADYIEVRRAKALRLPEIRQLAFVSLDQAIYEILQDTVGYLQETGAYICKESLDTYAFYQKRKAGD